MAKVPGLPTIIKEINNNPNLTPLERESLIEDARIMASDGKLSADEKSFLRSETAIFASPNDGATTVPITPTPTPTPGPFPDIFIPTPDVSIGKPKPGLKPVAPAPPPAVPQSTWDTKVTYTAPTGIKQASPDIIVFDEEIDPEFLVQAFFQEFGGTELINISRYDLINGDDVSYSPIINLSSLRQSFNPNNIIGIGAFQENPTKYGIDLFSRGVVEPYFNDDGDLVIEIDNVRPDESIEVEVASDGTINRIEL